MVAIKKDNWQCENCQYNKYYLNCCDLVLNFNLRASIFPIENYQLQILGHKLHTNWSWDALFINSIIYRQENCAYFLHPFKDCHVVGFWTKVYRVPKGSPS
jgi:hypothetical protein